jgi:hypothetical protein
MTDQNNEQLPNNYDRINNAIPSLGLAYKLSTFYTLL